MGSTPLHQTLDEVLKLQRRDPRFDVPLAKVERSLGSLYEACDVPNLALAFHLRSLPVITDKFTQAEPTQVVISHRKIATAYIKARKIDEARTHLECAERFVGEAEGFHSAFLERNWAAAFKAAGDLDQALVHGRKALSKDNKLGLRMERRRMLELLPQLRSLT